MKNKKKNISPIINFFKLIGQNIVDGAFRACLFDQCALEGNDTQNILRCQSMSAFNQLCVDFGQSHNYTWKFNWRTETNCSKK